MKLLNFYKWIAGSKSDFINQFHNNEVLFGKANSFWQQLEAHSWFFLVIILVLGIGLAAFYYKPYNELPHRHYKPSHWLIFLGITFLLAFFSTWLYEYLSAKPQLHGANWLEVKFAIGNALYTVVIYFVTSFVWCNLLPTNAYKFLKI